jgi:hypothetical protein
MRSPFRLSVASALACAALAFATSASADSPHFLYANASVSNSTGALTVDFKDAGLGTGTTSIEITLTVDTATATYQCWNNGGKHPQAGNKETVSHSLSATEPFPVRHGQTTSSISVGPPNQGDFTCPNGQTLFLVGVVSYSGITVSDETGNFLGATPDPATADVGTPPTGGIKIG